jgi:hypothetical protein
VEFLRDDRDRARVASDQLRAVIEEIRDTLAEYEARLRQLEARAPTPPPPNPFRGAWCAIWSKCSPASSSCWSWESCWRSGSAPWARLCGAHDHPLGISPMRRFRIISIAPPLGNGEAMAAAPCPPLRLGRWRVILLAQSKRPSHCFARRSNMRRHVQPVPAHSAVGTGAGIHHPDKGTR